MDKEAKLARYPKGDFARVVDTIGVPHPYCIGSKHLEYNEGVYLDIPSAEAKGAVCEICKGMKKKNHYYTILTHAEHETALLVAVDKECEFSEFSDEERESLQGYLKSLVPLCEEDGFAGFAFITESTYKESDEENKE